MRNGRENEERNLAFFVLLKLPVKAFDSCGLVINLQVEFLLPFDEILFIDEKCFSFKPTPCQNQLCQSGASNFDLDQDEMSQ